MGLQKHTCQAGPVSKGAWVQPEEEVRVHALSDALFRASWVPMAARSAPTDSLRKVPCTMCVTPH